MDKKKASELLAIEAERQKWGADAFRTAAQVGAQAHYSQFQNIMKKKSWRTLKDADFVGDFEEIEDDGGSEEDA